MSHLVTVEFVVTDLEALAEAAKQCGLEFCPEQTSFKWYGRSVGDYTGTDAVQNHGIAPDGKCAHALRIPGNTKAYEVGVVADPAKNGYRLVWDHFMRGYGLADHISRNSAGKDMDKLKQAYSVAAATRAARAQRKSVRTRTLENGVIELTISA